MKFDGAVMKIKENYALSAIAGSNVVFPIDMSDLDFTGMLTLNETGVFLWSLLRADTTREELAKALTEEYDVTYDEALADVDAFIEKLDKAGYLE